MVGAGSTGYHVRMLSKVPVACPPEQGRLLSEFKLNSFYASNGEDLAAISYTFTCCKAVFANRTYMRTRPLVNGESVAGFVNAYNVTQAAMIFHNPQLQV